jgi:phosphoesterase RecJ-like protein
MTNKEQQKMSLDNALLAEARKRIEGATKILIVSHVGPDGDAISSTLGLGLALKNAGKEVMMVLSDGVPPGFEHLKGIEEISRSAKSQADLAISVDCGDLERLGDSVAKQDGVDINIDHHMTNTEFASLNIVDAEMVASSAQMAEYLPELGLEITEDIASVLLTGILTDTLGFRTSNMNSNALRLAAGLLDKGAQIQSLYEKALLRRSFEAMQYWGTALVKLERADGMIWTTMTPEDRKIASYKRTDDGDLINSLASTEGAKITIVFIEQEDRKSVKVSWRSRGGYDVATLAASFGGGGHRAASGASIDGSLEEVQTRVLDASRLVISEQDKG